MAILIPTKRIYNIENNKLYDNSIERVDIETSAIVATAEEDVFANTQTASATHLDFENNAIRHYSQASGYGFIVGAYISLKPQYFRNVTLEIPKYTKDKQVKEVTRVSAVIKQKKTTYTTTGHVTNNQVVIDSDIYSSQEDFTQSELIQPPTEYTQRFENLVATTASITNEFSNETTIQNFTVVGETESHITVSFTLLVGYELTTLGGTIGGAGDPSTSSWLSGERTRYSATTVEFTIYANVVGTKTEVETIKYPENTSKKVFLVSNNELFQKENLYNNSINGQERIANQILSQYRNGKESVVLKCSINDYYEYDYQAENYQGALAISPTRENLPMSFKMYDEIVVMKMVMTTNGNFAERPLSKYKDGSAKVFTIQKIEYENNGVVFQILHAQEKKQTQSETILQFSVIEANRGSKTYSYESGSNWREWVQSTYNKGSYYIGKLDFAGNILKRIDNLLYRVVYSNQGSIIPVTISNLIQETEVYTLEYLPQDNFGV